MIVPTAFQVSMTGDSQSPIPVKITTGPGVIFVALVVVLVWLLKGRLKK